MSVEHCPARSPGSARTGPGAAQLTEITPGVFAYLQPDGSWFINNTGFILGEDQLLSIDTCATESRTLAYLAAIRTVTRLPVTTLVNTHHHGDHTNGNRVIGADIIVAQSGCREALARAGGPPPPGLFTPVDWGEISRALPTVCFERRLDLHVGDRRIELRHLGIPAHTTNDVVAWLPAERVLFAGDLVFNGGTPFALSGSIAGWLETLRSLSALAPEIVIPGHGEPSGPELLRDTADYLTFVQDAAARAHAAGLAPLQAGTLLDLGRYAELSDPERIVGNLHRAYAELDGQPRGAPLDDARCFADMVAFNGGQPLHCLA